MCIFLNRVLIIDDRPYVNPFLGSLDKETLAGCDC